MNSTESKYNFYARAFRGGSKKTTATELEPTEELEESPEVIENVSQPEESSKLEEPSKSEELDESEGSEESSKSKSQEKIDTINQQIPKTKVNFKISNIVGNLDQTLNTKQKINIDNLLMSQLFGSIH